MSESSRHTDSPPLVSGTTILILSIFLVGVTVGRGAGSELSPYLLCCGLAGILAFLVFDRAQAQRREVQLLDERDELASRLDRHVSRSQPVS